MLSKSMTQKQKIKKGANTQRNVEVPPQMTRVTEN